VVNGQRPLKFPSQKVLIRVFNFDRKFPSGSSFVLKAFQRNKIQSNNLDIFSPFVKGGRWGFTDQPISPKIP